jgi:hypothetical protein
MVSGFAFNVKFLDEDGYVIDTETTDVEIEKSTDPEQDRDEAYSRADTWAEESLELYGADDFEISLLNAY